MISLIRSNHHFIFSCFYRKSKQSIARKNGPISCHWNGTIFQLSWFFSFLDAISLGNRTICILQELWAPVNLAIRSFVKVTNFSQSVESNEIGRVEWSVRFCVVCCGSLRFVLGMRQIKEKWLHVHIDFCPQFAGGYGGWSLRESTNLSLTPSLSLYLFLSHALSPYICPPLYNYTVRSPSSFSSFVLFYSLPLSPCPSLSVVIPLLFRTLFCFPSRCIRLDFRSPLIFRTSLLFCTLLAFKFHINNSISF